MARPDPRKLDHLIATLQRAPRTYDELMADERLELSRRSLQTYLDEHLAALGYTVVRGVAAGPPRRATFFIPTADDEPHGGVVDRAAYSLARGFLEGLFPLDGTTLDALTRRRNSRVLAFASGVPRFSEHHMRALMKWIAASEHDPPRALWLRYDRAGGPRSPVGAIEPRLVWPVGVIVREGRRVYLPGLVTPAESLDDARNFALDRVLPGPRDCGVWVAEAAWQRPSEFMLRSRPRPQELVHAPFGLVRPSVSERPVMVDVRFEPSQAAYLRDRRWFPKQDEHVAADGSLDLRFGPVDIREAVAWCSQWIDGLTVLGDAALREAYAASLRARLRATEMPPPRSRW
jgi:hypothetical protein